MPLYKKFFDESSCRYTSVFNLERVMAGGLPFAFESAQTMRIGVMPRHGAAEDMTWIDTGEPCYAYHVVNCFDHPTRPGHVVVDVCKADATNALGMARGVGSFYHSPHAVTTV